MNPVRLVGRATRLGPQLVEVQLADDAVTVTPQQGSPTRHPLLGIQSAWARSDESHHALCLALADQTVVAVDLYGDARLGETVVQVADLIDARAAEARGAAPGHRTHGERALTALVAQGDGGGITVVEDALDRRRLHLRTRWTPPWTPMAAVLAAAVALLVVNWPLLAVAVVLGGAMVVFAIGGPEHTELITDPRGVTLDGQRWSWSELAWVQLIHSRHVLVVHGVDGSQTAVTLDGRIALDLLQAVVDGVNASRARLARDGTVDPALTQLLDR